MSDDVRLKLNVRDIRRYKSVIYTYIPWTRLFLRLAFQVTRAAVYRSTHTPLSKVLRGMRSNTHVEWSIR